VLWERLRSPIRREPAERDAAPGRFDACPSQRLEVVAAFPAPPVIAMPWDQTTIEDGESAVAELRLPSGEWDLSVQYDSTRPLTLSAPGFESTLPGNLDFRGPGPFWDAGTVDVPRTSELRVRAEVEEPPWPGRLIGANSVAHLGSLAATAPGNSDHGAAGCRGYVDWYAPLR
jgi:hypothetical protein